MSEQMLHRAGGVPVDELAGLIDELWANAQRTGDQSVARRAVDLVIDALDSGELRVATPNGAPGEWKVHEWVRKAVLLSFRLHDNRLFRAGDLSYFDKVDSKFAGFDEAEMHASGVRMVPPAMVRRGAYLAPRVVVMPSFVNIGAYVDEGCMVDAWANVGSCAQVGKNVHVSVGVCIGGVLEPMQATPTIIEDNCFIGTHASIVEGVIVERDSVIGMGVHIGQSTKILDRVSGTVSYGRVPSGSVVIPGMLPAEGGSYSTGCAVIVKRVDAQTRARTSINELLRP